MVAVGSTWPLSRSAGWLLSAYSWPFQVWQHCLTPSWFIPCPFCHSMSGNTVYWSSWFFPCTCFYSRSGNTVYCHLDTVDCHLDSSLVHFAILGLATLSTVFLILPLYMLPFQVWQHCLLPPWPCRLSSWFVPCPFCYSRSGNTVYCHLDSSLLHASISGLVTLSVAIFILTVLS